MNQIRLCWFIALWGLGWSIIHDIEFRSMDTLSIACGTCWNTWAPDALSVILVLVHVVTSRVVYTSTMEL